MTGVQRNDFPDSKQIGEELKREKYKERYARTLIGTVGVLIVIAAVAVLVSTLIFPVFRIYGTSMTPTVNEGEIVGALKSSSFECGDVVVLSFNNKLLVKRVIAGPGQWVEIDSSGNVTVDGKKLREPYITEKSYGDCNIKFPYQVPDERYFVLGDNRATSRDSRNSAVGCIDKEQIIGRAVLRLWPLDKFGNISSD